MTDCISIIIFIIGFGLWGVKLDVKWNSYIQAVLGNNHETALLNNIQSPALFYYILSHSSVLYCIVNSIWGSGHIVQIWRRKSFRLQKFSEIIWANFKIDPLQSLAEYK